MRIEPARREIAMRCALCLMGALCLLGALSLMAGCSKSPPSSGMQSVAKARSEPPAAADSVCDRRLLAVGDVARILRTPVTGMRPLPGDAESCEFVTAAFPAIIVSVRPGVGRTTLEAWTTGKMPLDSSPLPGVGDSAVWQDTLHEAIAQKNALLCDIQVRGGGSDLALSAGALRGAVGELCNKIFAAY